jgi:succinate dehydrogenase / fumarate reductase cytochrome b subunit
MSKSAILKSSIAKKWWMALTGLFLCLFLVGHLLGNLQLIFITGDEGQLAFNEYAYFMTHNPVIKIMSYLTYASILFHAIDGIFLTIQNKKARPVKYAYNKPERNSTLPSRYMAVLGSAILIFIVLHMSSFWAVMHFDDEIPLQKIAFDIPAPAGQPAEQQELYVTHQSGTTNSINGFIPAVAIEKDEMSGDSQYEVKNKTEFFVTDTKIKIGEGYKDLHSITMAYFGQDKSKEAGLPANKYGLIAVLLYVLAMVVLAFHLWHGFASAFQTLGLNNEKYTPLLSGFGRVFSILVPLAFAIIPVIIFLSK